MQPPLTLGDFFERIGAMVHFYTLGRRVAPCSRALVADFEAGALAWPCPWLGRARLACVFRLGQRQDPLIWFLSLPLDEQGFLDPAPRDAFLQRLLETLGRSTPQAAQAASHPMTNLMQDNPLAFTPDLVQRAVLHARASADLGQAASEHLEPVEACLAGQTETTQWQALGLQGLADFAVRHGPDQGAALARQLDTLPVEVLRPLCHCLEHEAVSQALCQALIARGERAATQGDIESFCACVRAVGLGPGELVGPWYDALLDDEAARGPDLLAAIAARGWTQLEDMPRLAHFIETLAGETRADFAALVRELALIPRLRLLVLMTLRQAPEGSRTRQRLSRLQ